MTNHWSSHCSEVCSSIDGLTWKSRFFAKSPHTLLLLWNHRVKRGEPPKSRKKERMGFGHTRYHLVHTWYGSSAHKVELTSCGNRSHKILSCVHKIIPCSHKLISCLHKINTFLIFFGLPKLHTRGYRHHPETFPLDPLNFIPTM